MNVSPIALNRPLVPPVKKGKRFPLARAGSCTKAQSPPRMSTAKTTSETATAIETVLMTSGSNGYHLRTALEPTLRSDQAAVVARGTAALAAEAHPDLMTLAFRKKDRGDRVFVDWLRNAPYSTSVVPWSLRARPGAPVAVPIDWDEIDDVDPNSVKMADVPGRFDRDPWETLEGVDLSSLPERVESALDEVGIELEPFDRFRS